MLLTALILVAFAAVAVVGISFSSAPNQRFMDRDFTSIVKRLCAVVVVFVHIPAEHSNALQDAVGSFAYVCVTLFFMFSAFGLKASVESKAGYIQHFVRNRLTSLLIPFLIMSAVGAAFGLGLGAPFKFVLVLLAFYGVFYLTYRFLGHLGPRIQDAIICAVVVLYSVAGALTNAGVPWYTEALGFLYGLAFYYVARRFAVAANEHYAAALLALFASSITLGVLYLRYKEVWFTGSYLLRLLLGVALVLSLLAASARVRIGNVAAKYLGRISYEVFLVHGFVMGLIGLVGVALSSGMYILVTITGSIVLASALNYVDVAIGTKVRFTVALSQKLSRGLDPGTAD